MKAWESILDQVGWSQVEDAGGRETPDVYRDEFKMMIESHIGGLLKQAERGKGINIEFGKRDDEDTHTESEGTPFGILRITHQFGKRREWVWERGLYR